MSKLMFQPEKDTLDVNNPPKESAGKKLTWATILSEDIIEICGIKYSKELFDGFGKNIQLNTPFEIINRNGVITFRLVDK